MSCGDNWQLVSARSGLGKKGKRGAEAFVWCVCARRSHRDRSFWRPSVFRRSGFALPTTSSYTWCTLLPTRSNRYRTRSMHSFVHRSIKNNDEVEIILATRVVLRIAIHHTSYCSMYSRTLNPVKLSKRAPIKYQPASSYYY